MLSRESSLPNHGAECQLLELNNVKFSFSSQEEAVKVGRSHFRFGALTAEQTELGLAEFVNQVMLTYLTDPV